MHLPLDRMALRVVFVLIGAALALALALVDVTVIALIRQESGLPTWAVAVLGTALAAVPLVALGTIPAMRTVEGVAATALLGVDLPGAAEPARTTSQRRRTLVWFVLHVLAGCLVVAGVTGTFLAPAPLVAPLLVGMVVVAAGLGAGLAGVAPRLLGPSYAERILLLEREVDRAVERNRLAREIHDSVGHALSLVTVQAGAARRVIATDPDFAVTALAAIEDAGRQAAADLDRVLGLLREDAAPRPVAVDLDALEELVSATRTAGLRIDHRVVGDLDALPRVVSREGYRVAQESLTNALRYSADGTAELTVTRDRRQLRISSGNPVADHRGHRGHRGDRALGRTRGGRGLVGVGERVAALGGSLEAGAVDGRWRLVATIPVASGAAPREDDA